jgi:DNA topoisomerase II
MSDTIESKYIFTTIEDSVRDKDWAAGSSTQLDSTEYIFNSSDGIYTCELLSVKYPPALWKMVDEPIVNALDHVIRCSSDSATKNHVTYIKITFAQDGSVTIANDGPGIDICKHKVASERFGREVMVPELIFGTVFQGSNRVKDGTSIIGGTNGIGAKIANIKSTSFVLRTVDATRKLSLEQTWRNGMRECDPPIVRKSTDAPYTSITFTPAYESFGYGAKLTSAEHAMFTRLFLTRAIYASAYANYAVRCDAGRKKPSVDVYYNDVLLEFRSMEDVARVMFPQTETMSVMLAPATAKPATAKKPAKAPKLPQAPLAHTWELCIVFTSTAKVAEISNVNGIVVKSGKHTKYLMDLVTTATKDKIAKLFNGKEVKFSSNYITNNVFILVNSKIPCPAWEGQRKDVLEYELKRFKVYTIPPKVVSKLTDALNERISVEIFNKIPTATGRKKATIDYEKYRPANYCGTKHSSKCMLIPVEGDSAMNHVRTGISESVGFDYIGVISTGGVIMNARTKSEVTRTGDVQYIKRSEQLENNKFFSAFCGIVGLNHNYKYLPGSGTYRKEMSELNYGSICVFVDQDLDGKGNILGSFLSMFEYWWPNLLRAGFVKWFCSPIIRAYPTRGGKIIEFYSIPEYNKWAESIGCASDEKPSGYNLHYYKGIGTHSRDEIIRIFKKYQQSILTYIVDDRSAHLFNVYFGSDPDLRKAELSLPSVSATPEQVLRQYQTQQLSCSDHLLWETNPYQKDNLDRKLPHVIDGQNQSGRKILDGILKAFGAKNTPMKIAVLAAFISERENYHHGEDGLAKSVTKEGFIGPGGKQIPKIRPKSNFGSRAEGGDDASPSRYIFGVNNQPLNSSLYPDADYHLLEFNFDEGARSEPRYFVPIIPVAICESTEIPAHGWKIKTWARDVFSVIANVIRMINISDDCKLVPMKPATYDPAPYNWTGTFKYIRGKLHSMGTYQLGTHTTTSLQITELPLREWTLPYINRLKKKAQTELGQRIIVPDSIIDSSNDRRININLQLQPGADAILETLGDYPFTDGVEEFFMLRSHMDDHLNFMGADGAVKSVDNYEDIMRMWFPVRKQYYSMRVDRELTIMKLKVVRLENVLRYVRDESLRLSTRKIAVMINLLTTNNYDRINAKKLSSPKFTPTVQLCPAILNGPKASYDYLLDLSDRAKSEEKILEYTSELEGLREKIKSLEELAAMGRFRGAAIWLRELEHLKDVITEGFRTSWMFSDFGKFTYE